MLDLTQMRFLAPYYMRNLASEPTLKHVAKVEPMGKEDFRDLPDKDRVIPFGFVQKDIVTNLMKNGVVSKEGVRPKKVPIISIAWDHSDRPIVATINKNNKSSDKMTGVQVKDFRKSGLIEGLGLEQGYSKDVFANIAAALLPYKPVNEAQENTLNKRVPNHIFKKELLENYITLTNPREDGTQRVRAIEVNGDTLQPILDTLNFIIPLQKDETIKAYVEDIKRIKQYDTKYWDQEATSKIVEQYDAIIKMVEDRRITLTMDDLTWISFEPRTFAALEGYDPDSTPTNRFERRQKEIADTLLEKPMLKDTFTYADAEVGGVLIGYSTALGTTVLLDNSRLGDSANIYDAYKKFPETSNALKISNEINVIQKKLKHGDPAQRQAALAELNQKAGELENFIKSQKLFDLKEKITADSLQDYTTGATLISKAILAEKAIYANEDNEDIQNYNVAFRKDGRIKVNTDEPGFNYAFAKMLQSGKTTTLKSIVEIIRRTQTVKKGFGSDTGIKNRTTYSITAAQTKNRYYPSKISLKLNEILSLPIQNLNKMDEEGMYSYEKTNRETGEVETVTKAVEVEQNVQKIIDTIKEGEGKKLNSIDLVQAARELRVELEKAILLEGKDRVKKIKAILEDTDAPYAALVEGALLTRSNLLFNSNKKSRAAERYPEAIESMQAKIKTGLADNNLVNMAEFENFKAVGTNDEKSRDRKMITSIYYDIVRNFVMHEKALKKLAALGEKTEYFKKTEAKEKVNAQKEKREVLPLTDFIKATHSEQYTSAKDLRSLYAMMITGVVRDRGQKFFANIPKSDLYYKMVELIQHGRKTTDLVLVLKSPTEINIALKEMKNEISKEDEKMDAYIDSIAESQIKKAEENKTNRYASSNVSADALYGMMDLPEDVNEFIAQPSTEEPSQEENEAMIAAMSEAREIAKESEEAESRIEGRLEDLDDVAGAFGLTDDDEDEDLSFGDTIAASGILGGLDKKEIKPMNDIEIEDDEITVRIG